MASTTDFSIRKKSSDAGAQFPIMSLPAELRRTVFAATMPDGDHEDFPNLPKLMEAVVKSLDPGSASGREAVIDAATQILGEVVKK